MWVNQRWQIKESSPQLYELLNKMINLQTELNEACSFASKDTQVSYCAKNRTLIFSYLILLK